MKKSSVFIFCGMLLTVLFACQSTGTLDTTAATDGVDAGVLVGIFHEGSQADLSYVHEYEKKLDKSFSSIMWYLDWSTPFPAQDVQRVSDAGYMPHLTWEPWFFADREKISLADILSGEWDEYINTWAKDAAEYGGPLLLRWGHEFNGNWYPWSVAKNGQDPAVYVDAYKKIHDMFDSAGADNVQWIWCANADSVPNTPWNDALKAYPGDEYVDWVGIDGYNFSGNDSFKTIFTRSYNQFVKKITKPVMIAEFATGGEGQKKGRWITEMAQDLQQHFPAVRSVNWFDIDKEMDWRLMVDSETEASAQKAFSSDYFLSDAALFPVVAKEYAKSASQNAAVILDTPKKARQKALCQGVSEEFSLGDTWPESQVLDLVSSDGKDDLHARISFAWNQKALFLKARVTDDVPLNNGKSGVNIWNGDNLEVCLGLDTAADPDRPYFGAKDFQIGFSTGLQSAGKEPEIWAWGSVGGMPEGALSLVTESDDGYVLEAMIVWASLDTSFIPGAGMEIGMDVAVDDADTGPDRESQTIWSGDSSFYSNPSQWGVLVLQ